MSSRRADIFKRILPFINTGRYCEWEGYVVFGAPSAEDLMEAVTSSPIDLGDHTTDDKFTKIFSDLVAHFGREQVSERASLGEPPQLKMAELLGDLSPEERDLFRRHLEQLQSEFVASTEQRRGKLEPAGQGDSIDAALTEELLGKLPKAVDRAQRLGELSLEGTPAKRVKDYFEEAPRVRKACLPHQNFLAMRCRPRGGAKKWNCSTIHDPMQEANMSNEWMTATALYLKVKPRTVMCWA